MNSTKDDTRERLAELIRRVLGVDIELTDSTRPGDHEAWDSVAHLMIVMAAESEFGMRFSSADIADVQSFGDLLRVIRNAG